MVLTARVVEQARPAAKAYKLADGGGLYLFVGVNGLRSWRSNYAAGGKQQTRTYGQYPALSLAAARKAHVLAKADAPAKAGPTFEQIARDWLQIKRGQLQNTKHKIQLENTLAVHVYPAIGALPVERLKRVDLVAVVKAVAARGTLETARRVAGRIGMVLNHAQDCGHLEAHPGAGLTRVLEAVKRTPMPSINPIDTAALLSAIAGYSEPVTRLALQVLALTFVRDSELRGMQLDEIKRDEMLWVIPAGRMKKRLPHVVPLTPECLGLIDAAASYSSSALVFESPVRPGKSIGENTLLFALYRLGYRGQMTAHGFRALASTVLNEQSGFAPDVIERQLAHQEVDDVRGAYNRAQYLDQRRLLMRWWADWLVVRGLPQ